MVKPIDHPIFGRLIPDNWNHDLMFFRKFPHMFIFASRSGSDHERLSQLADGQRTLVFNWASQPEKLAKCCRDGFVWQALQSMGVFEVSVPLGDSARAPSDQQTAAWNEYSETEETTCLSIQSTLLRYYQHARSCDRNWFEQNDCPECETIGQLARVIDFDGVTVSRVHAQGMSLIEFNWNPDWDAEHGLQLTVWRGQVVAIGPPGESSLEEMDRESGLWSRSQMNEAQSSAFHELLEHLLYPEDV